MSTKRGTSAVVAATVALIVALAFGTVSTGAAVEGAAVIAEPAPNSRVSGSVTVTGTATATNFQFYKLEFGPGTSPTQWSVIGSLHRTQVADGTIGTWDVGALPPGPYILKLTVVDNTGNYVESSVPLTVVPPGGQAAVNACAQQVRPSGSLTLVPLAARPASGSSASRGTIRGRVLDASGRGLCGQTVQVGRSDNPRTAVTGNDGAYEVSGLEPGTYSVSVPQQVSTPADGLVLAAGRALQVDFVQIRPVSATVTPTGTSGPTPTATATQGPNPLPPTPTASPTPHPRAPGVNLLDPTRWFGWFGIEVDVGALVPHLYLGIMSGFLLAALGVVVALVRR